MEGCSPLVAAAQQKSHIYILQQLALMLFVKLILIPIHVSVVLKHYSKGGQCHSLLWQQSFNGRIYTFASTPRRQAQDSGTISGTCSSGLVMWKLGGKNHLDFFQLSTPVWRASVLMITFMQAFLHSLIIHFSHFSLHIGNS